MLNKMHSYSAKQDANAMGTKVRLVLDSGGRLSPGQWQLLEDQMDRIYVDPHTKAEFKVSDYL